MRFFRTSLLSHSNGKKKKAIEINTSWQSTEMQWRIENLKNSFAVVCYFLSVPDSYVKLEQKELHLEFLKNWIDCKRQKLTFYQTRLHIVFTFSDNQNYHTKKTRCPFVTLNNKLFIAYLSSLSIIIFFKGSSQFKYITHQKKGSKYGSLNDTQKILSINTNIRMNEREKKKLE